ncbi:hypothetical protein BJY52DRAFT_1188255 [Lactarius psammicola]|nr:hypothetical protein BJY52DRAFT_1188255 [Lactarius psammicola]
MSTPQSNASTPPSTVPNPPVITVPTTLLDAVPTAMSLLSPPDASQGAPSPHSAPASHPEISPYAPPAPTPATHIANPTIPAPASISSYDGRAPTPPHGAARTMRYSYPTLPEPSHPPPPPPPPPRPIPLPGVNCFRRVTAHYSDSETVQQTRDDTVHLADHFATGASPSSFDQYSDGTVGARLQPSVNVAKAESKKATQTALLTEWFLNCAIGLQVLIGALTTALGATLSGKNTSVAISVLGGAATLVATCLARMRSSNEPEFSRLRAKDLDQFLREITAFQLDYGKETGHERDEQINAFRQGLEKMLGSRQGSVTVISEVGTTNSSGTEKGVGVANLIPGLNRAGMYSSSATNAKLGFTV